MSMYEYRCPQCETKFEALRTLASGRYARCPKCHHRAYKVVSTFSFKMDSIFTRDGEGFKSEVYGKDEYKERVRNNMRREDKC